MKTLVIGAGYVGLGNALVLASKFKTHIIDTDINKVSWHWNLARVVELVDTRDLKSLEGNFVPVRVRPRAPICTLSTSKHETSQKK